MENATKALLVAAAILISILLVSIAVMTFTSTSGLAEQGEAIRMTQEAYTSNSRFSIYFGDKVPGSDVISFLQLVIVNNSQTDNPIKIDSGGHKVTSDEIQTIINSINRSSYYRINLTSTCTEFPGGFRNDGHYGCITIKKVS